MRFRLRSLFFFTALVGAGLWCYQHLSVRFEYQPLVYSKNQFRWDYSIILKVH